MTTPCVCTTVRKASRALFRYYENALADAKLSVVQFAILRALERNGDMALSKIAEEQVMERTSLYRTMAPLIESGSIRLRDAVRGRAKIAALTDTGSRLIDETLPFWEQAQKTVMSELGQEEWKQLSKIILAIPALLQNAEQSVG